MRSEEVGKFEGEVDTAPHASRLTPHDQRRLRWRCRRGMLELDLPLERFLETHYHALTDGEKGAFERLLDYSDPDLWELIRDGRETGDVTVDRVVARLRGDI
ncbi:MAG: succinate dehydrogenase assembly factor 2 [Pseudomonadota bacterium]